MIFIDGRRGSAGPRRFRLATLAALGWALAFAGVAHAQNVIQLDEINVEGKGSENARGPVKGLAAENAATATKTSTKLVETPQSISVIGREQIDLLRPRSVLEAVRYSPGVTDSGGGSDTRTDLFQIRGFGANATGLFLDGLQLPGPNFAIFRLEPFGLERLEILRGPTSVLYGGASPGGLINGVSKKPLWVPYAHVETAVNNFGNVYGAFDISGPVAPSVSGATGAASAGNFAYRVVGLGRTGDTYVDFSREQRAYIAPSLTWRPTEQTSLTVLGSYQQDRANSLNFLPYLGTAQAAPFGFIPRQRFTGEPATDTFQRKQAMIGYELEHRFNETFQFRQNARYAHLETLYNGIFGIGYVTPPTATSALLLRSPFGERPVLDVGNIDNQLEARFRTGALDHVGLAGFDYRRISFLNRSERGSADPLDVLNPQYGGDVMLAPVRRSTVLRDQFGLYLQDQIKLNRWSLTVGGRQDFVQTRFNDQLDPTNSSRNNDQAFSGRAALLYALDYGVSPYVSYATSFEPQVGLNVATDAVLKPERGKQYEGGVKFQPKGFNGYASAAVFDLTKNNVAIANPLGITEQRGAVRSRGFEAEIVAKPTPGFSVIGAFTGFRNETIADSDPTLLGKTPPGTIDRFASLYLDYTLQTGGFRGLGFGAGVRNTGPTFADAQNTLSVPAYTLIDAGLHYNLRAKGLNASLTVQNLWDRRYVATCATESFCFYGEPRRITLTMGYTW